MHLRNLCLVLAAAIALAACSSGGDSDPGPPYDGEPNDSPALATPIPVGTPFLASIASLADVDYYSFTVPAGGAHVHVETLDSSGAGCYLIDTFVELYSSVGTLLDWDDNGGPDNCSDLYLWEPQGTYYVAVMGGYSPPAFPYVVRITVSPPGPTAPEVEPNGSIGTATGPFTGDAVLTGAISVAGEYDYYAISNATASPRTVFLETFTGALGSCSWDTTLGLYTGSGALLTSNDDGGVNTCSLASYVIPPYTTYYALVKSYYSSDTFSYLMEVDFQ